MANLDLPDESVCLEVGCGRGAGLLLINQYIQPKLVIGVDVDPEMIDTARKYIARPPRWAKGIRIDNIELDCQDATRLSFPDSYFDAAFLFATLEHITDWQQVITEISRVLKSGGVFSFEEFLLAKSSGYLFSHVVIAERELKDTLTRTGFTIKEFKTVKSIFHSFVIKAVKNN